MYSIFGWSVWRSHIPMTAFYLANLYLKNGHPIQFIVLIYSSSAPCELYLSLFAPFITPLRPLCWKPASAKYKADNPMGKPRRISHAKVAIWQLHCWHQHSRLILDACITVTTAVIARTSTSVQLFERSKPMYGEHAFLVMILDYG